MAEKIQTPNGAIRPITSLWVLTGRVAWLFAGPVVLGFLVMSMLQRRDGWIAGTDLAFLIILAVTVGARWLTYNAGDTSNSNGEPTTEAQLRTYSFSFLTGGVVVWILANIVGNHLR
ncbi:MULTISPECIES: hypothetical protein [unclassified Schlesneria]|uniref:hypothetical protein n=1 Tax=unclassified Schlesneria TaxID=2762017 RepID=UPI002EEF924C